MSASIINHRGKQIAFTDYKNCQSQEEMIVVFHGTIDLAKRNPHVKLGFIDFTGTFIGSGLLKEGKAKEKELSQFEKIAVIGIDGMKRILINGFNKVAKKPMRAFNTEEEALSFLVG